MHKSRLLQKESWKLPGKNTAIVDFGTDYIQDEHVHDDKIKVFNKELLQLVSKENFEDIEGPDALAWSNHLIHNY